MKLLMTACLIAVSMASAGAFAAGGETYKSPKDACVRGVEDARDAYAKRDIGEKASMQVQQMIEISAHLCEQGNFLYAEELLAMVRGMLATE